ncbi:MAG: NUDIX domain-containing protein [Candidatus Limiplasma sp.]|nr:NUDIX domain-containing protein [Candidatus Limiplasma sp.]
MGEYIMDMRKRVGPIPLMQCGASVIVLDGQNRLLLQRRKDNGMWGYAGGAVELYERVEDAAARELREETGLIADQLELLGVFSGPELRYTYPNGDQVSIVDIVYLCRKYHGQLRPQPEEVTELAFFSPNRLPDNLFTTQLPALDAVRNLLKK